MSAANIPSGPSPENVAKAREKAARSTVETDEDFRRLLELGIGKVDIDPHSRQMVPRDLEGLWRLAQMYHRAGIRKDLHSAEAYFLVMSHGLEVGLSPVQGLNNIMIINGRTCLFGDAVTALVWNSGKCKKFEEWTEGEWPDEGDPPDDFTWHCQTIRDDGRDVHHQFSVADAKRARLWGKSGPWTDYPKRQGAWRPRSWALRDNFADVLHGFGIVEEMQEVQPMEPPTGRINTRFGFDPDKAAGAPKGEYVAGLSDEEIASQGSEVFGGESESEESDAGAGSDGPQDAEGIDPDPDTAIAPTDAQAAQEARRGKRGRLPSKCPKCGTLYSPATEANRSDRQSIRDDGQCLRCMDADCSPQQEGTAAEAAPGGPPAFSLTGEPDHLDPLVDILVAKLPMVQTNDARRAVIGWLGNHGVETYELQADTVRSRMIEQAKRLDAEMWLGWMEKRQ